MNQYCEIVKFQASIIKISFSSRLFQLPKLLKWLGDLFVVDGHRWQMFGGLLQEFVVLLLPIRDSGLVCLMSKYTDWADRFRNMASNVMCIENVFFFCGIGCIQCQFMFNVNQTTFKKIGIWRRILFHLFKLLINKTKDNRKYDWNDKITSQLAVQHESECSTVAPSMGILFCWLMIGAWKFFSSQ